MKLFPGTSWTDLATAAVACISVAGVWWTFWPGHREKLRERREQRLERLLELHLQLQEIRRWAGTNYDQSIHRTEWYNPTFWVITLPWKYVEHFNRLVIARDYQRELTAALVTLEDSARRFHDMLADQAVYRSSAPKDFALRWPPVVAAAEARGSPLTDDDMAKIAGLTAEDRVWLIELYRRNKEIHVVGIGGPGGTGLHETCRVVSEELVNARTTLQAGRDTRWRLLGHSVAGLFVVLGLLFLFDFGRSFVDAIRHPGSRSTPASVASPRTPTRLPADTR